jgi:hypothetical protein
MPSQPPSKGKEDTIMTNSEMPAGTRNWGKFVRDIGIDTSHSPDLWDARGTLDVLSAEWLGLEDAEKGLVELRIRTVTDRVLCLDMWLEYGAIVDASDDYDEVDGSLVQHEYDFSKPGQVARFFGEGAV